MRAYTTPRIFPLTGNLRPGLVIQAATAEAATRLFKEIYAALPFPPGEPEPMMNIFAPITIIIG